MVSKVTEWRKSKRVELKKIQDLLWVMNQCSDNELTQIRTIDLMNIKCKLEELIKHATYGHRYMPDPHIYTNTHDGMAKINQKNT